MPDRSIPAVKICGLSTPDMIEAATGAGADMIGLVFFPRSPRNVSVEAAARLADLARGRARIVALMVDPDDSFIERVARGVRPDLLQLHGKEAPERVAEIVRRTGIPAMKAIKVETADDAAAARRYRHVAELILFDAKAPKGIIEKMPGGNGMPFDWRALEAERDEGPFMLSGGLTPENVAEAIRLTGAQMVDVSSGVESAPGVKDAGLIRRFVEAARKA
jgi:phosphoribosylanthranilate isomerase